MTTPNLREQSAVIAGSFADYRLVKSRSVLQVIVEIPIEQQGAAFAALGYPQPGTEIAVAVARLDPSAGKSQQPQTKSLTRPPLAEGAHKERRPWETLSPQQQAGILCADKGFQKWICQLSGWVQNEENAATLLRGMLNIESRRDIANKPELVAELSKIRAEFLEWAGRVPMAAR